MSVNWEQIDTAIAEMTPQEKQELIGRVHRSDRDERLDRLRHSGLIPTADTPPATVNQQRATPEEVRRIVREIASLATDTPLREFTNRDHDKILYGKEE